MARLKNEGTKDKPVMVVDKDNSTSANPYGTAQKYNEAKAEQEAEDVTTNKKPSKSAQGAK